jgi:hypothetical protein
MLQKLFLGSLVLTAQLTAISKRIMEKKMEMVCRIKRTESERHTNRDALMLICGNTFYDLLLLSSDTIHVNNTNRTFYPYIVLQDITFQKFAKARLSHYASSESLIPSRLSCISEELLGSLTSCSQ